MERHQGQFWTHRSVTRAWGQRRVYPVANPAAGSDWQWVPTPGYVHLPIGIHATLKTNEEAAERFPTLQVLDGDGNVLLESPPEAAAAAKESLAITWHHAISFPVKSTNHKLGLWLPEELLPTGYTIKVVTTGLKGTDQWESIKVWTKQYELEPEAENEYHEQLEHLLHHLRRLG